MSAVFKTIMVCIAASLLSACASPPEDTWAENARKRRAAQAEFRQKAEKLVAQMTLEAARFYSQWLVDRDDGILWTPAGTSPEASFLINGERVAVSPLRISSN